MAVGQDKRRSGAKGRRRARTWIRKAAPANAIPRRSRPGAVGVRPGALADENRIAEPVQHLGESDSAVAVENSSAGQVGRLRLITANTCGVTAWGDPGHRIAKSIGNVEVVALHWV